MARKVTVYNTIGGNLTVVESSASVWGDLQKDLDRYGISYHSMTAVVGATQNTLESAMAVIPEGDFQLFLAAKKVKSGTTDEYLISLDGINWVDEDWNDGDNIPEDHIFASAKDLAIARAKKAQFYLQKVVDYLINDQKKAVTDPVVASIQKTAEQIQRNLGLYD